MENFLKKLLSVFLFWLVLMGSIPIKADETNTRLGKSSGLLPVIIGGEHNIVSTGTDFSAYQQFRYRAAVEAETHFFHDLHYLWIG